MTKTLRDDQIEDLALLMQNERWGLLNDPGTGKTPTVCVYMHWLWTELGKKTVWTMPKSLIGKNIEELLEWTDFTKNEVIHYEGGVPPAEAKVFLMTFTRFGLSWRELLKAHPEIDAHVSDEIHLGFKGHGSTRTNEFYKAMKRIKRFVPMTGTLIAGRLSTCYPTIHVIEPRYYTSIENFNRIHQITDPFTGKVEGWQNHERLNIIFAAHSSRRTFTSVFGVNDPVIQTERVPMGKLQREAYDKFEKDAYLELEDRILDGSLPGVATIRCRQIMQHPELVMLPVGVDEETGKKILEPFRLLAQDEVTGKDDRLIIHLVDHLNSGKPLAIFAVFQAEQERIVDIVKKVGLRVGLINGNVTGNARSEIDCNFREGKLDVVVCSPQTAGVGFNWQDIGDQELDHMIFTSVDYTDDRFTQAYKRAIRRKRKTALRVTVLEYEKSLDQRLFQIVNNYAYHANRVDPTRETLALGKSENRSTAA